MVDEWLDTTVGEQATLQRGIDITKSEQRSGVVPVISSGGVSSYHDTPAATGPGVILGRKGVVGSVYFIESDYWPHDTTLWVKNFHGNDRRFVYYFFKWMAPEIARMDVGSANPTLNRNHVHPIEIRWPPLAQQRAIAHILGTLDDKIELNRQMNETLEGMARAIFKSWFVDFDPVRATAEGRDPGLPKHLADLFPDCFEDSEMGEIPAGWRVTSWNSLVSLEYGKGLARYDGENSVYPVYGTNGRIGSHSKPLCDHPGIIIGRKGAYRGVHYCSTPFYVIDTAFYVESKIGTELRWAYYELLRQDINGMDSGSAIPSTSREDFYSIPVLSPPVGVQAAFVKYLSPFWSRQELNISESRTLAALRETLLPKLISGDLRVQDKEKFIGRPI
jgi:type I restriction enzyme, S subunit